MQDVHKEAASGIVSWSLLTPDQGSLAVPQVGGEGARAQQWEEYGSHGRAGWIQSLIIWVLGVKKGNVKHWASF